MRLNFSGVGEDDIREGIRRIGEVVREQVDLYGTLTGADPGAMPQSGMPDPVTGHRRVASTASGPSDQLEPGEGDPELAKILRLPAQRKRAGSG
jgi:hypothetical protein